MQLLFKTCLHLPKGDRRHEHHGCVLDKYCGARGISLMMPRASLQADCSDPVAKRCEDIKDERCFMIMCCLVGSRSTLLLAIRYL